MLVNSFVRGLYQGHRGSQKIKCEDVLSGILDLLCSSVDSLTNPTKVTHSINSLQKLNDENHVAQNTVGAYMKHLEVAFLFSECKRFIMKGKSCFEYPNKYYCEDVGLCKAHIGFCQQELAHIMENIIYNELIIRRCSIDIEIVYSLERNKSGNPVQTPREIDFIASKSRKKVYIQSAYAMETDEKIYTENKPLSLIGDSFPIIIVRHDIRKRWYNENWVLRTNIIDYPLSDRTA